MLVLGDGQLPQDFLNIKNYNNPRFSDPVASICKWVTAVDVLNVNVMINHCILKCKTILSEYGLNSKSLYFYTFLLLFVLLI